MLNINFIHGDIRGWSCKKSIYYILGLLCVQLIWCDFSSVCIILPRIDEVAVFLINSFMDYSSY